MVFDNSAWTTQHCAFVRSFVSMRTHFVCLLFVCFCCLSFYSSEIRFFFSSFWWCFFFFSVPSLSWFLAKYSWSRLCLKMKTKKSHSQVNASDKHKSECAMNEPSIYIKMNLHRIANTQTTVYTPTPLKNCYYYFQFNEILRCNSVVWAALFFSLSHITLRSFGILCAILKYRRCRRLKIRQGSAWKRKTQAMSNEAEEQEKRINISLCQMKIDENLSSDLVRLKLE